MEHSARDYIGGGSVGGTVLSAQRFALRRCPSPTCQPAHPVMMHEHEESNHIRASITTCLYSTYRGTYLFAVAVGDHLPPSNEKENRRHKQQASFLFRPR